MFLGSLLVLLSAAPIAAFVPPVAVTRPPLSPLAAIDPASFTDAVSSLATALDAPPETAGISYSKASYYTILGLYLMSFPGLWSTIKRSTAAKVKRKTFVGEGEAAGGKSLREQAGEIMACK